MDRIEQIIVTGTSQGLGLSLVRDAITRGLPTVGVARGGAAVQDELYHHLQADLVDPAQAASAARAAATVLDPQMPTLLVNNAGLYSANPLPELTYADIRHSIDANLGTACNMTLEFMSVFRSGVVVFIGGANALDPSNGSAAYGTAKLALKRFADSLAIEADHDRFAFQMVFAPTISTWTSEPVQDAIAPEDASRVILDGALLSGTAIPSTVELQHRK